MALARTTSDLGRFRGRPGAPLAELSQLAQEVTDDQRDQGGGHWLLHDKVTDLVGLAAILARFRLQSLT